MIKVKDLTRLKAFGYEAKNGGPMAKDHSDNYSNCRIVVAENGEFVLMHVGLPDNFGAANWKYINHWFVEELYDLFAAGLLVRVNDNEKG